MKEENENNAAGFLSGGGEMGERIREFDWSGTSLGPPGTWPQSLKTCIRIMLDSRQPIWIGWGEEWIKFYNDPYISIVGGQHPWALGQPASEVWKAIWDYLSQLKEQVDAGVGTYVESQLLIMERNGYPEETYYTFSYTPVPNDDGTIGGMFCANTDDTDRITTERQLKTLTSLGNALIDCKTEKEVIEKSIQTLAGNPQDFPFALFYSCSGQNTTLSAHTDLGDTERNVPQQVDMTADNELARFFKSVAASQNAQVFDGVQQKLGELPKGPWAVQPDKMIVLPVFQSASGEAAGFLVVGVNPYRLLDEKYRGFFSLVADQFSTALADVAEQEKERKRAEALAEIDRAKTAFFTNISHEFRTPLTLMLGTLEETLNDAETTRKNTEKLEVTYRNAMRLLKLVNTLLDFSRLEAGRVKVSFQLTDIAQFTRDIASNFRSSVQAAGLRFDILTDSVVQPVYVDREMWEKIVLNLLSNAFKYTLSGGITISIDTAPFVLSGVEGTGIRLKVTDTGVGIPEDELPKMFQRFHRAHNVAGRTFEGTGIGLSLVKELVLLHFGEITVQSKQGEGSEFTVIIPTGKSHLRPEQINDKESAITEVISSAFIEEAAAMMEQPFFGIDGTPVISRENGTGKPKSTVLVVDDNADMRHYIGRLLQSRFSVLGASNGMDALHKIREHRIDIVVSDVMMPIMDGMQLLKTIKSTPQTSALPVILVSARAGEEARVEGYDVGADDYLVKPFSGKELIARVNSQLALSEKRKNALNSIYRLFDEAPFAVAVLKGEDLVIEYINQHNLDIWQQQRAAVLGKPLFEARPGMRAESERLHAEVYRTGKRVEVKEAKYELVIDSKSQTRYFNEFIDPMRNDEGNITGQLVIAIDVTEQVLAGKR